MAQENILVIDDEKLIRWSLQEILQKEGYHVKSVETGGEGLQSLDEDSFDAVLLDYKLPDLNGIEFLGKIRATQPDLPVIMITAHSSVEHAVSAMRAGANDYLSKPFRSEDIVLRVNRVLETSRLKREVSQLRREKVQHSSLGKMVGRSPAFLQVLKVVERILDSGDATILIQGESGTGKDVLARAIHFNGPRATGPYMNITCTAIPETLLESELFGHEKGSFTDAKALKKGLLELGDNGTVFLDEIGDMSMYLQGKLLRFLEEKTIRRVGGQKDLQLSVRVIAATNKDLKKLVEEGKFREDLYFRLKVIPIQLPPLRERPEDIPLLVQHFVDEYNREFRKQVKGVVPDFLERLKRYHWPGNIRELKNTIERAMILSSAEELGAGDLPIDLIDEPVESDKDDGDVLKLTRKGVNLEKLERSLVEQALKMTHGNQTRAGRLLGLNRDQIRYRLDKFGIRLPTDDEEEVA